MLIRFVLKKLILSLFVFIFHSFYVALEIFFSVFNKIYRENIILLFFRQMEKGLNYTQNR